MLSFSPEYRMMAEEARGLLTRLDRVQPFVLYETMVPAAALPPAAQSAIERFLVQGRGELRRMVVEFLGRLQREDAHATSPAQVQRMYSYLRLRFNAVLTQFDIFQNVVTQRSEHDTGVWLAGLDAVAADAMKLSGYYYKTPPVVCYLDRGHGAAIRRARTRLPGGGENPVAVIRIPRERMVGSGIASSLIHEVGHQGSILLDLLNSFRSILRGMRRAAGPESLLWQLWERWISEILADFWAVARIGISATTGLISVVSLPRPFVFRTGLDDPHPIPWIRVKLSCAMGNALYPHPQWAKLARIWESLYPIDGLPEEKKRLFHTLESSVPGFVELLMHHRPPALRGKSLCEAFADPGRRPERLAQLYQSWKSRPSEMHQASPSLVFAVIGQAKADGNMDAIQEGNTVAAMLTYWAVQSALDTSAVSVAPLTAANKTPSFQPQIPILTRRTI